MLCSSAPLSSAPAFSELHSLCISACPLGKHADLYGAVVCGARIQTASVRSSFADVGLIHLLVVSGSHFIALETLLRLTVLKITAPRFRSAVLFSTLVLFTLMTLASPPILRALFSYLVRWISAKFQLNWTRFQILTTSGFLCLPFCKSSWALCSLFLSWLAALALDWNGARNVDHRDLTLPKKFFASVVMNTKVYLTLIPPLLLLTVPHPLSILANVVFAPVMGWILFPMSLAAVLIWPLSSITDLVWSAVVGIVDRTAQVMPEGLASYTYPGELVALYLGGLTLLVSWLRRRKAMLPAAALLFLFSPHAAWASTTLIVWNVGQGSWSTLCSEKLCIHFDLGGEFAPTRQIRERCRGKRNAVAFSHWDLDHVGLTRKASRLLPGLCVWIRPFGEAPNRFRERSMDELPTCDDSLATELSETSSELFRGAEQVDSSNGKSHVLLRDGVIFPGDSGRDEEKIWAKSHLVSNAKFLVVGHHGSRTASSTFLLHRLRSLKMAIASARKQKYGHPNRETVKRFMSEKLPLLTTEDWGSIYLELGEVQVRPRNSRDGTQLRVQSAAIGVPCPGISNACGTAVGISVPSSRRR
jgi:competence protein ComEC